MERGASRVAVDFLPYSVDEALATLAGTRHLLLVGAKAPAAFFAYPDKPSTLSPPQCEIHTLAAPGEDVAQALEVLADDELDARESAPLQARDTLSPPHGAISPDAAATAVGALLPEDAIIVEEALTAASAFYRGRKPLLHTTICSSPATRLVSACRSLPGQRSPARTGRCLPTS